MGDRVATVDQLLDRILDHIEPLNDFPQPLLEALDLPSAEEAVAPIDLPSFDNSGMDGYAVRRAGEDVSVGDVLIEHGSVLGPRHLGLLASVGRSTVRSRPRPRVVILST